MNIFVGIVPPEPIAEKIRQIQEPFGDNRLEPHITVVPPFALQEKTAFLQVLATVLKSVSSFKVELTGTGNFGKGVLFVSVDAPELKSLYVLLKQNLALLGLPNNDDDRPFHAHLTLGRKWCGFTEEGFREMKNLANKYIHEARPEFACSFLRVYQRPPGGRYKLLSDVYFGS